MIENNHFLCFRCHLCFEITIFYVPDAVYDSKFFYVPDAIYGFKYQFSMLRMPFML